MVRNGFQNEFCKEYNFGFTFTKKSFLSINTIQSSLFLTFVFLKQKV